MASHGTVAWPCAPFLVARRGRAPPLYFLHRPCSAATPTAANQARPGWAPPQERLSLSKLRPCGFERTPCMCLTCTFDATGLARNPHGPALLVTSSSTPRPKPPKPKTPNPKPPKTGPRDPGPEIRAPRSGPRDPGPKIRDQDQGPGPSPRTKEGPRSRTKNQDQGSGARGGRIIAPPP